MLHFVEDGERGDSKICRTFLYGIEIIFKRINRWLEQNANEAGQILLLVVE